MGKKSAPKSYDINAVRAAASKRWPEILSSVCGLPRETFEGKHHRPCPWCAGTDRFRPFDDDSGGCHCNQCFNEKNGDGFATVQKALACDFGKSLRTVADYLGIQPSANGNGSHKESSDPAEHLTFQEWNKGHQIHLESVGLIAQKPGISLEAIKACGGLPATYRNQYQVVALPVYGPELLDQPPVGWCLYNRTGGPLPIYKPGGEIEWKKIKLTKGSKPGLIGQVAAFVAARSAPVVAENASADPNAENPNESTIWKCEGPSDVLAGITAALDQDAMLADGVINDTTPAAPHHIFLTNANGCGEKPQPWMLSILAGRRVNVIHDADKPGQDGAARWSAAIASTAFECRNVKLPYPIVSDHGPDLRDYFARDNHTLADLIALAANSPSIAAPTSTLAAAASIDLNEDERDPHRLARVFLTESNALQNGQLAIRYWQSEFYKHTLTKYRIIPTEEFLPLVNRECKRDFNRLASEKTADERKPNMVSRSLVNNVVDAIKSECLVSGTIESGTLIEPLESIGEQPGPKPWVAMENGILRVDVVLDRRDDQEPALIPHTPLWFSPIALPYDYDPEAECPKWLSFLEHNLEGDAQRIAILQEWAGYLLLPDLSQQKFLVLEGEGANGKSVYLAAIQAMVGRQNVEHVLLENFIGRFDLTATLGKLVNIAADCGEIDKAAEGKLKAFTSGDAMSFDRKGIPPISARPTARLIVATNNRPRFSDRTSGIWRRMLLVPFRVQITQAKRVLGMDDPTWWERSGELPGILCWAIAGLDRLRRQGRFTVSTVCNEAILDYQRDVNPARTFLEENYSENEGCRVRSDEIYGRYKQWCKDNGYHPMSDRVFGKEIKRLFTSTTKKQARVEGMPRWFIEGLATSAKIEGETENPGLQF